MATLAYQRLTGQGISDLRFTHPVEVVAWMGAMQGQDYPGVKWSVGVRLPDSTDAQIENAIAQKALLRTWLFRGTLHLVAGVDLPWMVALVGGKVIQKHARRYQELELDADTRARSDALLAEAVQEQGILSRDDLFTWLETHGIPVTGQRGYHLLGHASLNGLICQTTAPRNTPNFIPAPAGQPLPREVAIGELARRYFTSHGPATIQDFIWWSGLPAGEARSGLEAVKAELVAEVVAGETYWLPAHTEMVSGDGVYLLPGFDEYLLGYKERGAVLPAQHAQKVVPGGNGVFYPTIISDGQVVGTWKREVKKGALLLTPTPFETLTPAEEAGFIAAGRRYAAFMGLSSGG